MIQRFIELGEGYSDLYELFELAERMPERIESYLAIHSAEGSRKQISLALVMKKTKLGEFQPIYICLEGIPRLAENNSKRYLQFEQMAKEQHHKILELTVKPSSAFYDKDLYYQYILSILRMNRILGPYF